MSLRFISASAVRAFEQCPLAFHNRYTKGWPPFEVQAGDHAGLRVGSAVHEVLAEVGRLFYDHEKKAEAAVLAGGTHPALPENLAELFAPALARFGAKHLTSQEEWARAGTILAATGPLVRFAGQACLPEREILVEIAEGCVAKLLYDMVLRDCGITVVDWKLSGFPSDEWEDDPATGIYLAGARATWPNAGSWAIEYVFLETGQTQLVRWRPELEHWARVRMLSTWRAHLAGFRAARLGEHCGMCDFRTDCEPFQRHAKRLEVKVPDALDKLDDESLFSTRKRLADAAGLAEAARVECDRLIQKRIKFGDSKKEAGQRKALRVSTTARQVDPTVLTKLAAYKRMSVEDLLATCAEVHSTKLDALCAGDDEAKKILQQATQTRRRNHIRVL